MRIFMYCMMTGITLSGAIALGACPPASAAQPLSPSAVRIADADETPAQRDTYRQKANDDMQSWQRKMHDFGERVEVKGKENVRVVDIEPVGNYAIRIVFDDGHGSGIYTWEYLRELSLRRAPA